MKPAHTLVSFSGTFWDGSTDVEQWQWGLHTEAITPTAGNATLTAIANRLGALWSTHLASMQGDHTVLKKVQVAQVGADGHWLTNDDASYRKGEFQTSAVGSITAAVYHPLQTSLCVGLTSTRPGPTGKGRFFLPKSQGSLGADGRLSTADQATYQTSLVNFLNAVNADADLGRVIVASSKGYTSLVTAVRLGRVVDTIRSRRRSQLEGYVTTGLA